MKKHWKFTTKRLESGREQSYTFLGCNANLVYMQGQNLLAACGAGNTTAVIILLQRGTDVHFIGNVYSESLHRKVPTNSLMCGV